MAEPARRREDHRRENIRKGKRIMDEKEIVTGEKGNEAYQKGSYVKEVPDFRMDDNKSDVAIMKDFYTLIYGFLAQRVIDSFGAEGEQVIRRALRDFGKVRGTAQRERFFVETTGKARILAL